MKDLDISISSNPRAPSRTRSRRIGHLPLVLLLLACNSHSSAAAWSAELENALSTETEPEEVPLAEPENALLGELEALSAEIEEDLQTDAEVIHEGNIGEARRILQRGLDKLRSDGVVGALAKLSDDDLTFEAHTGVAQLDSDEEVNVDGYFRMGSNTKTFVAVVILQLVDEGKLRLSDTVEHWLPGLVSGNGNDGGLITIRQLLQHASGLHNYTQELLGEYTVDTYYQVRFEHIEPEELVALALTHEPNFPPGTSWSYSNTNYILAGMVIEAVTGRDWITELHERILEPFHLTHTYEPGDDPDLPLPHATGYSEIAYGEALVDVTSYNMTWGGAAGSLVTNSDDLSRFWRALQRGELLSPESMAEMHQTVPATGLDEVIPGTRDGLGIFWIPTRCGGYWTHFGDTFGYATRSGVDEDGTRAVVLSRSTTLDDGQSDEASMKALTVIKDDLQFIEDAMCVGR